jgi:hypothetical protein
MTRRLFRSSGDWPLAAAAAVLLAVLPLALLVAPGRTLSAVRRTRARTANAPADASRVAAIVAAVGRRPPFRGSCLSRAVAGLVLARWCALDVALVIGVRRAGGSLAAHAWLEERGRVLPPQAVDAYAPIWRSA